MLSRSIFRLRQSVVSRHIRNAHTASSPKARNITGILIRLIVGGAGLAAVAAIGLDADVRDTVSSFAKTSEYPPRTRRELRNALYWKEQNAESHIVVDFFERALAAADEEKMDMAKESDCIAHAMMHAQLAHYYRDTGKHSKALQSYQDALRVLEGGDGSVQSLTTILPTLSFKKLGLMSHLLYFKGNELKATGDEEHALQAYGMSVYVIRLHRRLADPEYAAQHRQGYDERTSNIQLLVADEVKNMGYNDEALHIYKLAFDAMDKDLDTECNAGVVLGQMADLAMLKGDYTLAANL